MNRHRAGPHRIGHRSHAPPRFGPEWQAEKLLKLWILTMIPLFGGMAARRGFEWQFAIGSVAAFGAAFIFIAYIYVRSRWG